MLFLKSGCAISTNNVRLCALKLSASIIIGTVPSNILSHQQNSHTHVQKTHNEEKWINIFFRLSCYKTSFLFSATEHHSIPHVWCQRLSSVLSTLGFLFARSSQSLVVGVEEELCIKTCPSWRGGKTKVFCRNPLTLSQHDGAHGHRQTEQQQKEEFPKWMQQSSHSS